MTKQELLNALALFPDDAELKSYAELQVELARLKEANKAVAEQVVCLLRENYALRDERSNHA